MPLDNRCRCEIELRANGKPMQGPATVSLILCPLHEAALELYDALEALMLGDEPWKALTDKTRAALAKANPAKWGPGALNTPDASTKAATGSKEKGNG